MGIIFKNKKTRVWFIVTCAVVCVLIVAIILASHFSLIINLFLGGKRPVRVESGEASVSFYEKTTASKEEANENAARVTEEVAGEGFILLKNDNGALPLAKNASVSVFGKNSVDPVYGGTGSGGGDTTFEKVDLYKGLSNAGFSCNPTLKAFYENDALSGKGRDNTPSNLDQNESALESMSTGETPLTNYPDDVKNSYATAYKDAAIVVFARTAGENYDCPMTSTDLAKHYLALDKNEKALLSHVCEKFDKVIVVLNTLNCVEADFLDEYDVDGCIWIGGPGLTGMNALGDILNGTVTPSGHTTDTWARDFTKDPTFNNFGSRGVENGDVYYNVDTKKNESLFYADYEENIYVGYRYYETRGYEESKKGNDGWYDENVMFPFGFGLSYTTFDWEVDGSAIENVAIKADGSYEITVTVKNTGAYKGKDVVEMYAKLPDYKEGGIERAYKVLCGFAKTPILYPEGDKAHFSADAANATDKPNSCTVTLTFTPYDIASYDYKGKVDGSYKGYIIEKSDDYALQISKNSHEVVETVPFKVSENIKYENDPTTGGKVENRYTDCKDSAFNSDTHIADSLMSRSDLSVLPGAYEEGDRNIDSATVAQMKDTAHNNPNAASYTMPTQGAGASVDISALVSQDKDGNYVVEYGDEPLGETGTWKDILDALTVNELAALFNNGGFGSIEIESISKPLTYESDGPVGWCNFIATDNTWKGNNVYTVQVVMSATWNVELIEEMGEAVGEEGLWGSARTAEDAAKNGVSYSGWYAPGVNIHRSPFGGRNFEYFSEDSYLTGTIAAAEIRGCRSKGVNCYVKHFALNEQETHRGGGSSWVTEQAMREIYLKAFEIAVKESNVAALMSSFNRIGTRWTGGDYRLLTEILRNEWGFRGTVICDYNQLGDYMNNRQMIYAGGDLNLCTEKSRMWNDYDKKSAADVTVLRMAAKNILYSVASSNAMNSLNLVYLMPIWQIIFIIVCVLIPIGLGVWGFFVIRGALKKPKEDAEDAESNQTP